MNRMGTAHSNASRAVVAALALFGAPLFCSPPSAFAQTPLATGPVDLSQGRSRADLDPDEPEAVVQEIDRLMTRPPDIMSPPGLNREIARWQALSAAYPASRAEHWLQAGEIALAHGVVRYTDKISQALVAIRDLARLDEFLTRCLEVARRGARHVELEIPS